MKKYWVHLITAVTSLGVYFFCAPDVSSAQADSSNAQTTNVQTTAVNTNIVNQTTELHKTIIDQNSGRYAAVDEKLEVVTLKDSTGNRIWSKNIVEALNGNPWLKGRKIRGMQVHEGGLWVDMGRGYALIDLQTGEFKGVVSR